MGAGISLLVLGCDEPPPLGPDSGLSPKSKALRFDIDGEKPEPSHNSVSITNGLPAADPNFYEAIIDRGGSAFVIIQDGSNVLFEMFGVLDLGPLGVFQLNDPSVGGDPVLGNIHTAFSRATILTSSGQVEVRVLSRVGPGKEFLGTVYNFISDFDLSGARFFEYVDLDILGFSDDAFSSTGCIATGDLVLTQTDIAPPAVGPVVKRASTGFLSGYATDLFPQLRTNILAGGFNPPPLGDVKATAGDITSAFEHELHGRYVTLSTGVGDIVKAPNVRHGCS